MLAWRALVAVVGVALALGVDASAILSQGTETYDSDSFTLVLDKANGVATELTVKPGSNAGTDAVQFLLQTDKRTDNGFNYLGDIQIRFRNAGSSDGWTNLASAYNRADVAQQAPADGALATADITPSLGGDAGPIKVTRTWAASGDELQLKFDVTNSGDSDIEIGGLGFPLPWGNDFVGQSAVDTWEKHVFSDPAPSMDAGYVLVNRLTGVAPSVVSIGGQGTPLEQHRFLPAGRTHYPDQFTEKTDLDYLFEGVYAWYVHSLAWHQDDVDAAADLYADRGEEWNKPTSDTFKAGETKTYTLRLFPAKGPLDVEPRLREKQRPTMKGVPGFVGAQGEKVTLIVDSDQAPTIEGVEPNGAIDFGQAESIGDKSYRFTGTVGGSAFGRARVTLRFGDSGEVGTAHYYLTKTAPQSYSDMGRALFRDAYYTDANDFFKRAPSVITYDRKKKAQVTTDTRSYVCGLGDDAGSATFVAAAIKERHLPSPDEVKLLEDFATKTLWGQIQVAEPGNDQGGVHKSIYYYDEALVAQNVYDTSIPDYQNGWGKEEAEKLGRSYNYPHAVVTWYSLYKLARFHDGLTTLPWQYFLDRAYDTIMAMQRVGNDYAQAFGLMEGTYFLETLRVLQAEGNGNETYKGYANDVDAYMKDRADRWNGEQYPYASEFPWDNTGQEEVFAWLDYYGYSQKASETINTLLAVMSDVPIWAYSGIGRSQWDFLYAGAYVPSPGGNTARLERIAHHYKGAISALPLLRQYMNNPAGNVELLRRGFGAVLGSTTLIDGDGHISSGFHTREDFLGFDSLSGDAGIGYALTALGSGAYLVNENSLGGWVGFGASVDASGPISVTPTDAFQRLVFIAPEALLIETESAAITKVVYDNNARTVQVSLSRRLDTDTKAALRIRQTAKGVEGAVEYALEGDFADSVADFTVIPLGRSGTATVTLRQK